MALVGTVTADRSTSNDNAPKVAVPAGASVGQLYCLVWSYLSSSSVPAWPEGFTEVLAVQENTVLGYTRVALRVCDGTESGFFLGSTSSYQQWEARCFIIGGVQASPEDAKGFASYAYTSTAAATGASVTSGGAGRCALWIASSTSGGRTAATASVTPPAGFSPVSSIDRGDGTVLIIADSTIGAGSAAFSGSIDFGGVADSRGVTVSTLVFAPAGPQITGQPTDQIANAGASATFTASASGATSGQWQDNSSGTFADIAGETGTSLTVSAVTYAMQGRQYRYAATGSGVTVYTNAASLRVATNLSGTGTRAAPVLGAGPLGAGPVSVNYQGTAVSQILLAASCEASPSGSAILTTGVKMSGSATATPTTSATMTTAILLSGAATPAPALSGSLAASIRLAVVVYAAPGGSATLTTGMPLSGAAGAGPSNSGALTTGIRLAASAGVAPEGQGTLATGIPLAGEVKATPGAQSSLSTNMLLSARVEATPDGAASLLTLGGGFAASVEPGPAATGVLATQILLSAQGAATPAGVAALSTVPAGLAADASASPAGAASLTTGVVLEAVVVAEPGVAVGSLVGPSSGLAAVCLAAPGGTADLTTSVQLAAEIMASPAMRAALTTGSLAGVSEDQILAAVQAELEKPGGVMELLRYLQTKLDAIS